VAHKEYSYYNPTNKNIETSQNSHHQLAGMGENINSWLSVNKNLVRAIAKYILEISACDSQSATPSPALPLYPSGIPLRSRGRVPEGRERVIFR
jgi:hypothetical protein